MVLHSKVRRNQFSEETALTADALDQLFRTARTQNEWTDKPVDDDLVYQLYDLLKWGPTASDTSPARFVGVRSPEGKARLASVALPPNKPKILVAPLTVIIGNDLAFADSLPKLLAPERLFVVLGILKAHEDMIESMAMRNGSLQGAYLMLAARALGLDCWPMSGFDNPGVDREFFCRDAYPIELFSAVWAMGTRKLFTPGGLGCRSTKREALLESASLLKFLRHVIRRLGGSRLRVMKRPRISGRQASVKVC